MYVVYHRETTRYLSSVTRATDTDLFATQAAAKAALTRAAKKDSKINRDDFLVAESTEFRKNIEKTEMVTNIMTGALVEQSVNTPWCCSVQSESYWSA